MPNKLPQGWVECELKNIFDIVTGKTPSKKHSEYFGGEIPFVKPGDLDKEKFIYSTEEDSLTEEGFKNAPYLPKHSVLVSCIGNLGKKAILGVDGSCNQQINVILPNEYANFKYVYYYIDKIISWMEQNASATTVKILNKGKFEQAPFLLPPLNEQKRIVKKIEEEFGKVDEGVEKLKLAQEQIKQYRQSVLKSAFDGKLYKTTEWEEKTLEEITSILGDGLHGTPKYSDDGDYYFINGNNLNDGVIQIKDDTKKVDEIEYQKYKKELNENTVFVSINGTLGNTAFYNNEKIILGKSACYFNLLPIANKEFIRFLLKTNNFINYANTNATGSTIKNVSLKTMRAFKINLPTLDEQKQIVKEIEKRFEVADEAERVITENLEKAEQLKQSILKKAFEGRLVPQDPTDEPASILLNKIKHESEK